jgi:hypothetical protein
MRKKALLAGAGSSFEGPWVNLEPGEWLVEPIQDVEVQYHESTKAWPEADGQYRIRGPIRIRAIVLPDYKGSGIFVQARQITTTNKEASTS